MKSSQPSYFRFSGDNFCVLYLTNSHIIWWSDCPSWCWSAKKLMYMGFNSSEMMKSCKELLYSFWCFSIYIGTASKGAPQPWHLLSLFFNARPSGKAKKLVPTCWMYMKVKVKMIKLLISNIWRLNTIYDRTNSSKPQLPVDLYHYCTTTIPLF